MRIEFDLPVKVWMELGTNFAADADASDGVMAANYDKMVNTIKAALWNMEPSTAEEEGAWQCGDGHMFFYAPPPAYPPWCSKPGCFAKGEFKWIIKDEVTSRDWPPKPPQSSEEMRLTTREVRQVEEALEEEPPVFEYDSGPEVDDQGGMSEFPHGIESEEPGDRYVVDPDC
jgi:hypothetical protein